MQTRTLYAIVNEKKEYVSEVDSNKYTTKLDEALLFFNRDDADGDVSEEGEVVKELTLILAAE